MKIQINKDKILRKNFSFFEKRYLVFKYVVKNLLQYSGFKRKLKKKIRYVLAKKLNIFKYSKTRIIRRCILTGRARSTTRILNISRIKMRELIKKNYISEIKKKSW